MLDLSKIMEHWSLTTLRASNPRSPLSPRSFIIDPISGFFRGGFEKRLGGRGFIDDPVA
jgi:hypothetical protein